MAVALDSDAAIGFLDRGDSLHAAADDRIRELVADAEPLVASTITYAEVLTGARLGRHPEQVVWGFFDDLIAELVPVDRRIADRGAELRAAQRSLRLPDALILATADIGPEIRALIRADRRTPEIEGLGCEVELLGR